MNLSSVIESIAKKQIIESDWAQLVKEMSPLLLSNSYKFLNDQSLSKDAVQETFLHILKNAHQFRTQNDLAPANMNLVARGWIMKINRNICLDILRGKKRRKIREENYQKINESMSMEDIASMQEFRELLRRELAGLSPKDQMPIVLKYYSGLNNVEIAREMGCQPSSVGVLITRAIEKLKNKLAKSGIILSIPFLLKYMEAESASMGLEIANIDMGVQFESLSFFERTNSMSTSRPIPQSTIQGGLVMKLILASVLITTITTALILSNNDKDLKDSKSGNHIIAENPKENKISKNIKPENLNVSKQEINANQPVESNKEVSAPKELEESISLYLPFHKDSIMTFVLPDYSKTKEDFKKSPIYKVALSRELEHITKNTILEILEENDVKIPNEIFDFILSTAKYLDENLIRCSGQVLNSNSANIVFELKSNENAKYLNDIIIKPISEAHSLGCTSFVYQNKLFVAHKTDLNLESLVKKEWDLEIKQNEFLCIINPKFDESKEDVLIKNSFESAVSNVILSSFRNLNKIVFKLSFNENGAEEKFEFGFHSLDKGFFNLLSLKKTDPTMIDQLPEDINSLIVIPLDLSKIWLFVQTSIANIIAEDKDGKLGFEKKWKEVKSQMDMMCTMLFQADFQKFISEDILGDLILFSTNDNNAISSQLSLTFKNEEIANKVAAVLTPMKAMVLGAEIVVEKNKIKLIMKYDNNIFTSIKGKSVDKTNLKALFKANEKLAIMSFTGADYMNSFNAFVVVLKLNNYYGIKPKMKDFILSLGTVKIKEMNEWYYWQMADKDKSLTIKLESPLPLASTIFGCVTSLLAIEEFNSNKNIDSKVDREIIVSNNGLTLQVTTEKTLPSINEDEAKVLKNYDNGKLKYEMKLSENKDKIFIHYDYEGIPYRKDYYNDIGIYLSEIISENGEVFETTKYSQNEEGLVEVFNKKSVLIKKYFWRNNEFNGEYSEWYESNKIKTTGSYVKSKWDGKWESFYENGNKKSISEFKIGTLISSASWFLNGSKRFEANVDKFGNGSCTYYYEDGKIKVLSPIKLNSVIGDIKGFYQNGNKAFEASLSFGSLSEYFRVYYPWGQLKREEKFQSMSLSHITYYFENGQKEADGEIIGYNPCPTWQIFDESGKLKVQWNDIDSIDDNFRLVTSNYLSIAYPFYNTKYLDKQDFIVYRANDPTLPYKSVNNYDKLSRNMNKEKVFEYLGEGLKNEKFKDSTDGILLNFLDLTDFFTQLDQKDYYLWSVGQYKIQVCIFENNKLKEFYQRSINFKP